MKDKNSLEKQLGYNGDNSSNRGFTSAMDDGKLNWSRRMYKSELRRRNVSTHSAETAPTSTSQNEDIGISPKGKPEAGKEHIASDWNNPATWAHLPNGELDPSLSDLDPKGPETPEELRYWQDKGNVLTDWRRQQGLEYQQFTPVALDPEQVPLMSITQYSEIRLGDPTIPTGHPMHPDELAKSCKKLVEEAQKEFKETTTHHNVLDNMEEFNKRMENITRLFKGITRLSEIYSTHVANNEAEEAKREEITKQIVKIIGPYHYPESTATVRKWQEMEKLSKSIEEEMHMIKKRN